jgi:hypothetical protein
MLYAGAFGIVFGIAVGQHFKAIAIGAAALAAGGWALAVGTIAGHGLIHAVCDALFLAWCLETGFFLGLVLRHLAFLHSDQAASVAHPSATPLPD